MRTLLILVLGLHCVAAAEEPQAKPPTDKYGRLVLPLTIRGQATNDKGEPVAGAKVFVHSMNHRWSPGEPRVLAETTTSARGKYVFEALQIPVLDTNQRNFPAPIAGKFQVYGLAAGYGHTWHVAQTLNQEARPKEDAPAHNFYAGEACMADLKFEPAATISGTIIGDNGLPLAGVRVQVGQIDDDRRPENPGPWSVRYLGPPGSEVPAQSDEFGAIIHLPPESRSAVTDAMGKYSIGGLRRETEYLARIGYLPEFDALGFSLATTERKLPGGVRSLGYAGTLDEKLIVPRTIAVVVTASGGEQRLADVMVRAGGRSFRRVGNQAKTDDAGGAVLRLPPGKYKLHLDPPPGAAFIQTQADLTVAELPFEQTLPVAMQAGAALEIQAVEAGTGKPIAGVSFTQETDSGTAAQPLQSQSVFVDHPTTDAAGTLRAIVPAGARRLIVAGIPKGWEPLAKAGEIAVLKAGQTHTVKFEFQPAAAAQTGPKFGPIDPRLAKLAEQAELQQARTRSGTFHAKYANGLWQGVKIEDLRAVFNSQPRDKVPDLTEKLSELLKPERKFRYADLTIVADGLRKRSDTMSIFEDRPASHQTLVFNGVETAEYRPENAQASIYGNEPGSMRYAIASVDYLCGWPFFYRSVEGQPTPELKVEQDNGLLRVELTRPQSRIEQSIDAKTAFLYHYLSASDNGSGTETWQFAPHELPGGGMLAGLSARFSYTAQRIVAHITVLQDADLTPPPASAFALPAPSGTNVVDFRGNQQRPKSSVTSEPVPDVVARANAIADDHRSILPVVQVGQPAPALKPVSWLTASGKCEAPDLKGKVVLVDFWGTNCGFCIVQLPDVQAAHKRLASKGLVIVGMHDAGGEVEAVAQLAKKHGLTYLLAIDRPAEGRGFGAICESYGIRGIPNCAVIDQAGKVAFVGDFLTAAYAAEKLLAVK